MFALSPNGETEHERAKMPKTQKVAIYPNGARYVIRKTSHGYNFRKGVSISTMRGAIACVEANGGYVITEPYTEPSHGLSLWDSVFNDN
jgi:hypothetical protein